MMGFEKIFRENIDSFRDLSPDHISSKHLNKIKTVIQIWKDKNFFIQSLVQEMLNIISEKQNRKALMKTHEE